MCQLSILRLHYTGQMTLEQLSTAHECDAAAIVDAHEALPPDERATIDAQWAALKLVNRGLAPPDDPIFSGGVTTFTTRRKRDAAFQQDVDTWLGDEFKNGLEAQSRGEDPTPRRDSDDE